MAISSCGGSDDAPISATPSNKPDAESKPPATATHQASEKTASSPSRTYSGPDIAGLHLGMSPDEVRSAMKAYNPDLRLQDSSQYFEYNALGKRHKTVNFPTATHGEGQDAGSRVTLAVAYSYPPAEPVVVAVTRLHRQSSEPLTQADYAGALIDKYGVPVEDTRNSESGSRAERTLRWKLANTGEVNCVRTASVGNSVLNRFIKDGQRMAEPSPEYAAQCAGLFEYVLRGDPVTSASGTLFDVWAQAKSEFAAREWVEQQIADKSKTGNDAPKL